MRKFVVHVYEATVVSENEVWPDGDGPRYPTAEDVAAILGADLSQLPDDRVMALTDWGVLDKPNVAVTVLDA